MRSLIWFTVAGLLALALLELTQPSCAAQSATTPRAGYDAPVYSYRSYYRAYYPMYSYSAPAYSGVYYPAVVSGYYPDYWSGNYPFYGSGYDRYYASGYEPYAASDEPYYFSAYYAPRHRSYYSPLSYYGAGYTGYHYWP